MKQGESGASKGDGRRELGKEYERRFAKGFIARNKRDRFIRIASHGVRSRTPSPARLKRVTKYRQMLSNLRHWFDDRVELISLSKSEFATEELLERLARLKAPRECYSMSLSRTLDGQWFPLAQAVEGLSQGDNQSTLLICRPESLAFFWHGEVQSASAILRVTTI